MQHEEVQRSLERRVEELECDLATARSTSHTSQDAYTTLEKELNDARDKSRRLQVEMEESRGQWLQEKNHLLRATDDERNRKIALESRVKDLDAVAKRLEIEKNDSEREKRRILSEREEEALTLSVNRAQLAANEKEADTLRHQVASLEKKLTSKSLSFTERESSAVQRINQELQESKLSARQSQMELQNAEALAEGLFFS